MALIQNYIAVASDAKLQLGFQAKCIGISDTLETTVVFSTHILQLKIK